MIADRRLRWPAVTRSQPRKKNKMCNNDYIMRMIEEMSAFLAYVVFHKDAATIEIFDEQGNLSASGLLQLKLLTLIGEGRINEAENLLFEQVTAQPDRAHLQAAHAFYAQLDSLSDAALTAANFSRAEIDQGRADLKKLYQQR